MFYQTDSAQRTRGAISRQPRIHTGRMKNVFARKRADVLIIPELFHANRTQARVRGVALCPKGLLSTVQCPPDTELDKRELFVDIRIGDYCPSREVEVSAEPCFSLPACDNEIDDVIQTRRGGLETQRSEAQYIPEAKKRKCYTKENFNVTLLISRLQKFLDYSSKSTSSSPPRGQEPTPQRDPKDKKEGFSVYMYSYVSLATLASGANLQQPCRTDWRLSHVYLWVQPSLVTGGITHQWECPTKGDAIHKSC
ncbi:uncharacterized protein Aud_007472 [Aspergillus udagawae]|uniref:Uncharacterized protein n=1 Tax=Aspergillus udagawae TaxID=91492 RepID=A0A8E0V213_9EURO|nr:uncharacterized protein Aud_007472 [Aspergillus udagawae]GIC91031.1 hypothetical protein Aud_007472 [Aspergillus udagawae]